MVDTINVLYPSDISEPCNSIVRGNIFVRIPKNVLITSQKSSLSCSGIPKTAGAGIATRPAA